MEEDMDTDVKGDEPSRGKRVRFGGADANERSGGTWQLALISHPKGGAKHNQWTPEGTGRPSGVPICPWTEWIQTLAVLVPSLLLAGIVSLRLQ